MQTDTILHGDIRQIARTLPTGSVHCIVTSPPYYGLRDYGVEGQLGLEATPQEYVDALVGIFRELKRVLRDDGSLWLNLGDSYASQGGPEPAQTKWQVDGASNGQNGGKSRTPGGLKPKDLMMIPARVALALQADGWYLRADIIWSKPNPMPESVSDRPTKAHEYIFLLSKSPRYYYDQEAIKEPAQDWGTRDRSNGKYHNEGTGLNPHTGLEESYTTRNRRTVWAVATQPYAGAHFATFPPDLIRPCILAGCPERVCADCGAPWVRVVEKKKASVTKPRPFSKNGNDDRNDTGRIYEETETVTTGFRPTCTCNAPTVPGVVFDPFMGSGTVGQVAIEVDPSRRWLGCELSQDYIDLAQKRIDEAKLAKVAGRDYAKVMTKEENGYQQLGLINDNRG